MDDPDLSQVFERVSQYFSLLAEPMRLRILHSICEQEKTVGEIVEMTGATQTNISRHLSTMYHAGVLSRRKDGNFIYYGVADPALTGICRSVCVHIASKAGDAGAQAPELLQLARRLEKAQPKQRTNPKNRTEARR